MKSLWLAVVLFVRLTCCAQISTLPSSGKFVADILIPVLDEDFVAISRKFEAGVQSHGDWLQKYIAAHPLPAGEILPYHENFGISEEEYERLVSFAKNPRLKRFGKTTLEFITKGERLAILVAGLPPEYTQFEFDRSSERLSCGIGVSTPAKEVSVESGGALGPWHGATFRFPPPDGAVFPNGDVSIGQDREGHPFIYVDFSFVEGSEKRNLVAVYRWTEQE